MIWQEKGQASTNSKDAKTLGNAIQGINSDLQEAQLTCAVQVTAAKQQSNDKITQLETIQKEPDQDKRIEALAKLIG